MGRIIRRVPANWKHPQYSTVTARRPEQVGRYIPLFEDFDTAIIEFDRDVQKMGLEEATECWGTKPSPDRYTQYNGQPHEWWQLYETVSEGTPVSPPFETPEELIDYLVENGDFSDQEIARPGYSRKAAEAMVGTGWAPSMVQTKSGRLYEGAAVFDIEESE